MRSIFRFTPVLLAVFLTIPASAQSTVAIHDIQGAGATSPLSGQTVTTSGVVTALRTNGFFMQAADSAADGNPATSEGIFVFTSSQPSVVRGDRVNVTGRVTEYVPSSDPGTRPLTEISGSPTVTVTAKNEALPTPVVLTTANTPSTGGADVLERFEGMRVHVDELFAIGPTGGSVDETTASATSNGVFWAVIAGIARPVREPGVDVLDVLPSGAPCCVPRFDGNPERLRIETAAQPGAPALEVNSGASVRNTFGILDWAFRTWSIVVDVSPTPRVSQNYGAGPLPSAAADEFSIAAMNLQRMYDTRDTRNLDEPVVSSAGYARRVDKVARAIVNYLQKPDVIAINEAEDLFVLDDIAAKVSTLTQGAVTYTTVLFEGHDISGIDTGFLVNNKTTQLTAQAQELWTSTFISPRTGKAETLHDRPPLRVEVTWTAPSGGKLNLTVLAIHNRSLSGIDTADDGTYVRYKRKAQAESIASLIQSTEATRPNAGVIVLGDFNAFDFSDGYVDVTGAIIGTPAAADHTVTAIDRSTTVEPELGLLGRLLPASSRYTYVFRGTTQALDHIAVSSNLMPFVRSYRVAHLNADFPETLRNEPTRVERFSDHDVPLARFSLTTPSRPRAARR